MTIWLNGRLMKAETARIDPTDRGLLLGDGLFETLKVRDRRALHVLRHLERLRSGAGVLGLPIPYDDETLEAAMDALLEAAATAPANGSGTGTGTLRLTVTRGPAERGLLPPMTPAPTVLMTTGPAAPQSPIRAVIATVTRRNERSPLSRIKTLNYLDNILARQEAADHGADDAVLLNTAGRVAETTIANIFVVRDGGILTPPVEDGALPGVRRALLLRRDGVGEESLSVRDLQTADEIFVTNSGGIRPVIALDGRPVGTGHPGPVFMTLAEAFADER